MKRTEIRAAVESHLVKVGFDSRAWTWSGPELLIAVGSVMKRVTLKSGMAKRDMMFEMGRIAAWAEMIVTMTLPGEQPIPELRLAA
ncbi:MULTISPECIES: hypothetical protein [Rhodomicrobium]|uniref:hypothetical protein n=1 Tax=Rhodomicrobium TaxID=1068 RepID=UPI000F745966|nr:MULTISPECIES: hypothetical protein [Rhodomicrobium]